jgi:hypothetical protein
MGVVGVEPPESFEPESPELLLQAEQAHNREASTSAGRDSFMRVSINDGTEGPQVLGLIAFHVGPGVKPLRSV